jgi:hypothetical protein
VPKLFLPLLLVEAALLVGIGELAVAVSPLRRRRLEDRGVSGISADICCLRGGGGVGAVLTEVFR